MNPSLAKCLEVDCAELKEPFSAERRHQEMVAHGSTKFDHRDTERAESSLGVFRVKVEVINPFLSLIDNLPYGFPRHRNISES